ncbi:MAG: hypothetical protein ACJZ19_03965 [Candidatus Neomarinimicrobiota bacterium]
MNRVYSLFLITFIAILVKSCSSTSKPVPITKKKINLPSWTNGVSSNYKKWYGVGTTLISDSSEPEQNALLLLKDQILLDIKRNLNKGFNFEDQFLDSIAKKIIDSRLGIIKSLTKVDSVFNSNNKKYVLASIDKDVYYAKIKDKLNSLGIENKLNQIESEFSGQTFITLSPIVKIIVENFDLMYEDKNNQYSHFNIFRELKMILSNFNDRIDFLFTPKNIKKLPIINSGQNLSLTINDRASSKNLNGINIIQFNSALNDTTYLLSNIEDSIKIQPVYKENNKVFNMSFKINFDKMINGNYTRLFDLKPKEFNIVILPPGATLFLKGSLTSLGSGLEKSVFSDLMKSCFESNYGVEFVDNYDAADLEMYFEVFSNDNLTRESRKQAFKSEAYLNLKLIEINSKKIILDYVIASKKASNYDFVERAGIDALKNLSEESLNVLCD